MKEKAKKKKILVSVITSICSTAALILTSNSDLQVINTRCLWVLGCIYLALGWYFLFWNYDLAQFATIRNRMRQVIVVFCSVLIACFLFTVLPLKQGMILKNQYYQKELAGSQTAQIRTLGEKNQKASGYQVWLEGIRFGGSDLNLYELKLPEGWEFREDRPYTQQQAESELIIPLSAEPDYTLMIRRGPDAGMVKVTIGDKTSVVDLYAEQAEKRAEVDLKQVLLNGYQPHAFLWERVLYNAAYILNLWMLAFTGSVVLFRFCVREKHLKNTEEHHENKNP